MTDFKLTYATMFNPPEELHTRFDAGLAKVKAGLGKEYAMIINNQDVFAGEKQERRSPVNTDWLLAVMQKGNESMPNRPWPPPAKPSPAGAIRPGRSASACCEKWLT